MAKERRYRPRKQIQFWLYTDLQTDEWLLDIIAYWKTRKQFATMVKNGIRLMWSLGQGHVDVLFELFPQLETQLAAKYSPTPPDNGDMQRQIENAVAAGVEKAMQNFPALPAGRLVAEPAYKELGAGVGSTLGTGKLMALPTFDDADDDDTVVISTAALSMSNSQNSMASMLEIAY